MDWERLRVEVALDWNRRAMSFPSGAACHVCGVSNPLVLVLKARPYICYRCQRERTGHPTVEEHHLGRRPSPREPVAADANLHRVLSYLQYAWKRVGVTRGSDEAVLFDLLALRAIGPDWESDDRRES